MLQTSTASSGEANRGTGTSANGENVSQAQGIDLIQIYPGYTNNLQVLSYIDVGGPLDGGLCCSLFANLTGSYLNFLLVVLGFASLMLFIGFIAICAEFLSYGSYAWYGIYICSPLLILLGIKLYVVKKLLVFKNSKHENSLVYHDTGRKFYYAFYGDSMISLTFVIWWLINLSRTCIEYVVLYDYSGSCEYYTSFEESVLYATFTWCIMFPFLIYVIAGYFGVYRQKYSDFDLYFQKWSFRQFDTSNDIKYCLNYHHTTSLPTQYTILCNCCGTCCGTGTGCCYNDCHDFVCCCPGCNECDGVNSCCCCGANCCSNGVKCSLIAISSWQMVAAFVGGIYVTLPSIYYIMWGWVSLYSLIWIFYGVALFLFHYFPAYYACRLINYKYNCCARGAAATGNEGELFHYYSVRALKGYSALAALWFFAFMIYFLVCLYFMFWGYFAFDIWIFLWAFVAWLPFEAIKLIDTLIKMENYYAKKEANSIDMDSLGVNRGNVVNGNNNLVNVNSASVEDQPQDGGIITALQVATK